MMKRKAFTLIEALVCLACIGILLAILTVAVQAARESSRRAVCANNLKSLGDGIQIYLNTHSTFPESISREQFSHSGRPPTVAFPGPAIQTLRSASGNSVYVELLIGYGYVSGNAPNAPDEVHSLEGHHGLMMCPSNPKTGTSYRFSCGSTPRQGAHFSERNLSDGPFGTWTSRKPSEIFDGLSFTSAVSERVPGNGSQRNRNSLVYPVEFFNNSSDWIEDWNTVCQRDRSDHEAALFASNGPLPHALSYWQIYYSHFQSPNSPLRDCYSMQSQTFATFSARSNHQGGVNVCYLDSSVRFRSSGTNIQVWQSEGNINGSSVSASDGE